MTNNESFSPNLSKGKTLDDLNKAHLEDLVDGGNREEQVYPSENAIFDNATQYAKEVRDSSSPSQLNKVKSRLENVGPEDKSEFSVRTAEIPEAKVAFEKQIENKDLQIGKWEELKNSYLTSIGEAKSVSQLKQLTEYIAQCLEGGSLGESQVKELAEATEIRKVQLWEELKNSYLTSISEATIIDQLTQLTEYIAQCLEGGSLGESQVKELAEATEIRKVQLWEELKNSYLTSIGEATVINQLDQLTNFVTICLSRGSLGESQVKELTEAIKIKASNLRVASAFSNK